MDSESKLFGPYNLGNPLEFTVLELAEMIIDMTNSKSDIVFKDLPQDDPLKESQILQEAIMTLVGSQLSNLTMAWLLQLVISRASYD